MPLPLNAVIVVGVKSPRLATITPREEALVLAREDKY